MSKAIVNALTIALMEMEYYNPHTGSPVTFEQLRSFATRFVEDNAELFVAKAAPTPAAKPRSAYELSPEQEQALATGVGLCPNCQQPKNDHLPGCSRAGADPNDPFLKGAVTKNKLNPVA